MLYTTKQIISINDNIYIYIYIYNACLVGINLHPQFTVKQHSHYNL